jgi:hypothetical protein
MSRTQTTHAVLVATFIGATIAFHRPLQAAPAPALTSPPPVYLKQGESQEVTFTGQHLAGVTSAAVPDPRGVEAALVKPDKPQEGAVHVKLSASADAPLGVRELRFIGPTGVTETVPVTIGQYPLVLDKEPNNTREQAQPVQFPACIAGKIEPAGDIDRYRFDAKAGQHLIFDVFAVRLGSQLEPVLAIHDSEGKELSYSIEHHDVDPLLVFDAPADGSYVLEVSDLQYRGGGDYVYRIDAGQIPYVESLSPGSGQRGSKVEVTAIGHNLAGGEKMTLDLSGAAPGPMPVRFKTPLGYSNEMTFAVSELTTATEQEPNNTPQTANPVNIPAEISGTLDKPGDEDWFKFHVAGKQTVTLEVIARRTGSPVDALLTLKNAKGEVIEASNGPGVGVSAVGNLTPPAAPAAPVSPDAEAKISKELEPGDYFVSIRDLTWAGGPSYAYRLEISPFGGLPPDFNVRFLPDAPRLHRGGNVKLWCDVERTGGYKGDITITLEGLPTGVTAQPITLAESTSGIFTLAATNDAALGAVPIKLKATGVLGSQQAVRYARPELNTRTLQQAYLTVLDPAPFTVEAVALLKPEQIQQYGGEAAALARQLDTQTPQLDAALAEWEKHAGTAVTWTALDVDSATAAEGTTLTTEPDGAILAGGASPERNTYTVLAHTNLKGITAIRLELLPDPSLPGNGPGRSSLGNLVLNTFAVTAVPMADKDDKSKVKPVNLRDPHATFSQDGYPIAGAIDKDPKTGWALMPQLGRAHVATFLTESPVGGDGGTTFGFVLDQQYGEQHTIGKFRISVTTDKAAIADAAASLPAEIAAILKTPADKRTPEQAGELKAYYRSLAPELAGDRQKLEALRNGVGPYAELARLESILNTGSSALDAEQTRWEREQDAGAGWTPLTFSAMKSAGGATFTREADGSLFVGGNNPATDVYTLTGSTPVRNITAVRIEVLPDERLPGDGPGRSATGNFVLTRLQIVATPKIVARPATPAPAAMGPKPAPTTAPAPVPVELHSPRATFEQTGWPALGALDDRNDTGWGISPNMGRPNSAIFLTRSPIAGSEAGSVLTFTLDQLSGNPQHTIGRFRIWVTANPGPDAAVALPAEIRTILRIPALSRNEEQKAALAAYHRSIDTSLDPVREREAEVKSRVTPLPLTTARNRTSSIPVPVQRAGGFRGDIQITLEGFSSGRDPATGMPTAVARDFALTPLTIAPDSAFGKLTYKVNGNSEIGTRLVVLKAEAQVGDETVVQYSPAFPLTVNEK